MTALATTPGQCSRETAQQLTDQLRRSLETSWQLFREAFDRRAWAALGYESWDSYCINELTTNQYRLSRELRQQVVVELTSGDKPMSNRAVASALGVSPQTVTNDRKQVSTSEHLPDLKVIDAEIVEDEDTEVIDEQTGVAYCPAFADCMDEEFDAAIDKAREEGDLSQANVVTQLFDRKVTGSDGKTYTVPAQQKPRRRPLVDDFLNAITELDKAIKRIDRLADDDRFPRNAEEIATRYRGDLLRAIDSLVTVAGQLPLDPRFEDTK